MNSNNDPHNSGGSGIRNMEVEIEAPALGGKGGGGEQQQEPDEVLHRKRLAKILRYVAIMHQQQQSTATPSSAASAAEQGRGHSFVREYDVRAGTSASASSDFFQRESVYSGDDSEGANGVLFTSNDFRRLLALESTSSLSGAFSFYAASSGGGRGGKNKNKRTLTGALKTAFSAAAAGGGGLTGNDVSASPLDEKGYWVRITRNGATASSSSSCPHPSHPVVKRYVRDWLAAVAAKKNKNNNKNAANRRSASSSSSEAAAAPLPALEDLMTSEKFLDGAPKVPPGLPEREREEIASYLRRCRKHVRRKLHGDTLEGIYDRLFEWVQASDGHLDELVFGLGHARSVRTTASGDGSGRSTTCHCVNGPLLEVLVEVELAPDGALLVRPRQHTGVSLNRQVVSGICGGFGGAANENIAALHRDVSELESSQLSPGQPSTYVPLLRRISVELSPGGTFQPSSSSSGRAGAAAASASAAAAARLVVSEAWCLYSRPKPASVWARDASAFADQLMQSACGASRLVVPQATWSITHGPGVLQRIVEGGHPAGAGANLSGGGFAGWLQSVVLGRPGQDAVQQSSAMTRPMFPLPTSDTQNRIAEMLLEKNYPAVVCEGPPGSGKTHTIANVICAYLCQGKRVLVTSKNAPALSVLRERLPESVRELCVDVSMSELSGMRQLQKTVERLANRVACSNPVVEGDKCELLQKHIFELEAQLKDIDVRIERQSEKICNLLRQTQGERMVELARALIQDAPWLMKSIASWEDEDLLSLHREVASLCLDATDPAHEVTGFSIPPCQALVSYCSAKAGSPLSTVSIMTKKAIASVPFIGETSGMEAHNKAIEEASKNLRLLGSEPATKSEWEITAKALRRTQAIHSFQINVWRSHRRRDGWPEIDLFQREKLSELKGVLDRAVQFKQLLTQLNVNEEVKVAAEVRSLDVTRNRISSQLQLLAVELVDAKVVKELSQAFSPEAQSALIQFSQIAGKAKFARSSQASKMTQRQRRRRQEYLDAFDRCSRFIPCWVLTTSQISNYLQPECLFDLIVIDEASQSDVTVLPSMLRGSQWLIVGDGKQVSPTECFVSEDQIDSLRAAIPSSPLESSLLPGHSFFDMCSQAFPRGRVVLKEHFRCAEEIISFSNSNFYDGRLVPLRLPTRSQRLVPSVVDIKLDNGVKTGKVNRPEANRIVELIQETLSDPEIDRQSRSIGVISLMGDEQSRLIRGRLLDTIGPEKISRHHILVGDPPTFQGAERDIVFLSMVCSRGCVPTQNQLMHCQRANVAMSRARDRCVLVRSIDIADIPSFDDVKIPIIEFFQAASAVSKEDDNVTKRQVSRKVRRRVGIELLQSLLGDRGYDLSSMGEVWENAICVEHQDSDVRAAILVDCEGESNQEWRSGFMQQKAIERVGWKCLRIDALTLFADFSAALESAVRFLSDVGIEEATINVECDGGEGGPVREGDREEQFNEDVDAPEQQIVITISSDTESVDGISPSRNVGSSNDFGSTEEMDAAQFGEVVNLDFLKGEKDQRTGGDPQSAFASRKQGQEDDSSSSSSSAYEGDQSDAVRDITARNERLRKRRRRLRSRLDQYSRDPRWYPDRRAHDLEDEEGEENDGDEKMKDCFDSDSDLRDTDDGDDQGNVARGLAAGSGAAPDSGNDDL